MPGPVSEQAGGGGLSWSWDLDIDEFLAALAGDDPRDLLAVAAGRTSHAATGNPGAASTVLASWLSAGARRADGTSAGGTADGSTADGSAADAGASGGPASGGPAAGGAAPGEVDQEAVLEEILAARDRGEAPALTGGQVAARVAERIAPGPGLAALLACVQAGDAPYRDLPAIAAGFRRIQSWAAAGELAAVAQIASKAATGDPQLTTAPSGEPSGISRSAAAEVSYALAMAHGTACAWTSLAATLTWQLPATKTALAAGDIDLPRARLIADATSVLPGDLARAVEAKILPGAGQRTTAQLRAALARAVITADPQGAELRRLEAEHHARVRLYPDPDGTATLTGNNLSAVHAAAAMARIAAMARAWKTAGAAGSADRLRAKVFLSLLLGTNPVIPPPLGAPPDRPSPDGGGDPGGTGGSSPGPGTSGTGHGTSPGPGTSTPGHPSPGNGSYPDSGDPGGHGEDPGPGDADAPPDDGLDEHDSLPGAPEGPALDNRPDLHATGASAHAHDGPAPAWPAIPPALPPGLAPPPTTGPARGMLDLTLSWDTLARGGPQPGYLSRVGPFTAPQAARLARIAARSVATQWRIVLTNPAGQALAVTRATVCRRPRTTGRAARAEQGIAAEQAMPGGPAPPGMPAERLARPFQPPGPQVPIVGRVTVIVPQPALRRLSDQVASAGTPAAAAGSPAPGSGPSADPELLRAVLAAARQANDQAMKHAAADTAAGGCAHQRATPAYRPAATLREHVAARDRTCRSPGCQQPAWRTDLDHTTPHDQGGRTCNCNLGGVCRTHHQLKQTAGWNLSQIKPGHFTWTSPAGRSYHTAPDSYLAC